MKQSSISGTSDHLPGSTSRAFCLVQTCSLRQNGHSTVLGPSKARSKLSGSASMPVEMQRPVRGHLMRTRVIPASCDASSPLQYSPGRGCSQPGSLPSFSASMRFVACSICAGINPDAPIRFSSSRAVPGTLRFAGPCRTKPANSVGPRRDELMIDFAEARRTMVEGQVRTYDVTDLRVLAAMLEVPREHFVPDEKQALAYADGDLSLVNAKDGRAPRYLLKPAVLARLIQEAEIAATDRVLDVGCATGYSSAVLSKLAGSIVALEEDSHLASLAREKLAGVGAANVTIVIGRAPGRATVYRSVSGHVTGQPVFDAAAPLLPGFAKPPEFVF